MFRILLIFLWILLPDSLLAQNCNDWRQDKYWESVSLFNLKKCIRNEVQLNSSDENGLTPLHLAVKHKSSPNIAYYLIKLGSDPDAVTPNGKTPLHVLLESYNYNSTALANILIDNGADPNIKDHSGSSPLHIATQRHGPLVVAALLNGGADPSLKDDKNKTPFDYAKKNRQLKDTDFYWILKDGAELQQVQQEPEIFLVENSKINGKRIALVIGNADYVISPLENPVNDSSLIARTLRKVGFEVLELENADQKSMKIAIKQFGKKLNDAGKDAVGLFFFSGHGAQTNGTNYMIPVTAEISSEADLDIEAVSANNVLSQMEYANNGLNIVILDACRNNPFSKSFRSSSKGLAVMDAPQGSILAYATSPGNVAYDGEGRNSPYTKALAKQILEPNLQIEEVFKRVRISVVKETGNEQVPWEASSLMGNFYFLEN